MNELRKNNFRICKICLSGDSKKMKLIIEEFEHFSNHKLMPHLLSSYVKLNTSTSQLFRNKGYKINELYIPLTLKILDTEEVKVDKYPAGAIEKHNKIIIKDTAGMGKSTVLKMLFRYCFDTAKRVPIYIDLKSLIDEEKIIPVEVYMHKSFPSFTEKPSQDFINLLLQRAPFLFLFDGADEVPDKHKPKLFKEISDFQAKASNSAFIIATRDEDKILSSFNDFTSASIQPLKKNEAYLLLERYQFEDVKASDLITEIEKPENASVLDFLKNPLLTTLLYTAYAYKKKVPLKKSLFFKQIYEALYENHDATKIGYLTREKNLV
ncbi:NACHT domain-containing protein [Rheinheimera marina]|uniref:NACHT domain-containing protein n=1 Tax=Rheinheimera marina TaxID=1774958 RepID=A0ABV9JKP7_9GAMM